MPETPSYTKEPPTDPAGAAVVRIRPERAVASNRRFSNVEPGMTVREGGSYDAWDFFRPDQAPPVIPRDKIAASMQAHERFGVIRNTIDMMSEFSCQGIDLVHPDPSTEKFYKEWWRKVRGAHVTERQLNLLFRAGTVPTKRTWGTLTVNETALVKRGLAAADSVGDVRPDVGGKSRARRIPWRYTILNPLSIVVLGGDVAPLIGDTNLNYGVRINKVLIDQLRDVSKKNLYPRLQQELDTFLSALGGGEIVPLPPDDLCMQWYKKDDWQLFPTPMLFSLFRDLQSLDQLKLADMSALDGAASQVRLWKLGSVAGQMWPSQTAVDKLGDILAARAPGEVLDIIWGPDIELVETHAEGHKFLGSEKYAAVWAAIFGGLGVPLSLTGVPSAGSAGTTNNWASLKTLIERLEYGRRVAAEFWENEIRLVQRAMGFRKPAMLVFDRQSLSDETAILRLLLELMDRNVVSREAVQERFSLIPEIEKFRLRREDKASRKGTLPKKGGPWDDPTFEQKTLLELIRQQRITPQQANVNLTPDPALPTGKQQKVAPPVQTPPPTVPAPVAGGTKSKGEPGKGRPPGKKDSKKRKPPRFSPRAAKIAAALIAAGIEDPPPQMIVDVDAAIPSLAIITAEVVREAVIGVFNQNPVPEEA